MRIPALIGAALFLLGAGTTPAGAGSVFWSGDSDLSRPDEVLKQMRQKGATELPLEALALYEQGLAAAGTGDRAGAVEHFRAAVKLDPSFPEPHLAMARIHLFTAPQEAFSDLWQATRAVARSFGTQHLLLVNTIFCFILLVGFGGIIVTLYALAVLLSRVHHVLRELLERWFPRPVAWGASAVLLAAPLLWRVGGLPILVLYGGLLWPWMRTGERRWSATLVGLTALAPLLLWGFSPVLFSPLDPQGNAFLIGRAMVSGPGDGLLEELDEAHEADPENANLNFALAMIHKRAGHTAAAEEAYKTALRFGGPEAPIYNNLGILAYHRGRYDDAIGLFQEAVHADPGQAAAHYNLSQAYAKRLYFDKADEELSEANRLSFNRIRSMIKHQEGGINGTLLDEPLPASTLWSEAWSAPHRAPGLPSWLSPLFPGAALLLPVVCIPVFVLGLVLGTWLHRMLPSFACSNCGHPVCRRCLRRIRRRPYCKKCGDALLQIQSAAYSRLVLDSRLRRTSHVFATLSQVVAWILPGYHALRLGRSDLAAALTMGFCMGLLGLVSDALPVTRLAWLESGPGLWWPELPIALLVVVQAVSIVTVFKLKPARLEGPSAPVQDDEDLDEPDSPWTRAA